MADKKLQKVTKLLEMEKNPIIETLREIERLDFSIENTQNDIKEIQDSSVKIVEAINDLDQTKADKIEVERAIASVQTIKGDRGFKGEKGDAGRDGKDGVDGVDGIDGKDGINGTNGKDGVDGRDGSPDTPDQVIEKIHKSKKLIKKEKIEGLDDLEAKLQIVANRPQIQGVGGGASGIRDIRAGQNISVSKVNEIYTIGLNYTPTDTDEKVKYDASDLTAGYIADKFVAGTGITLAEGTGANENKLVINNSLPFDWDYDYADLINTPDLSNYLALDQTSPQTITGGTPKFDEGIEIYDLGDEGYWKIGSSGDEGLRFSYGGGNDVFGIFNDSIYSYVANNNIFASSPYFKITESSTGGLLKAYKTASLNSGGLTSTQTKKVEGKAISNVRAGSSTRLRGSTLTSGSWSFTTWVKPAQLNTQEYILTTADSSNQMLQIGQAGGYFTAAITNNYGTPIRYRTTTTGLISSYVGNWHLVIVTHDGSTLRLYVDGVERTTTLTYATSYTATAQTAIGSKDYNANTFLWSGLIDQSLFYDGYVLTGSDMTTLYNSGMGLHHNEATFPQGTAGVTRGWEFDEGSGTTAVGFGASPLNLTLGSASWATGLVSPVTAPEEWDVITTTDSTTLNSAYKVTWGDYSTQYGTEHIFEGLQHQWNVLGTSKMSLTASAFSVTPSAVFNAGMTINEVGGDNDTRIEGDTDQNLFFVDASTDRVGFGTNAPTQKLDINSDSFRLRTAKTPSSASDTGTQGQIAWDANYLYVCTATNTWKRSALSTW